MSIVDRLNERHAERKAQALKEYESIVFELAANEDDVDAERVEAVLDVLGKTSSDLSEDVENAMVVCDLVSEQSLKDKHDAYVTPLKELKADLSKRKTEAEALARQLNKELTITSGKISQNYSITEDRVKELKDAESKLAVSGLPTYVAKYRGTGHSKFLDTQAVLY